MFSTLTMIKKKGLST